MDAFARLLWIVDQCEDCGLTYQIRRSSNEGMMVIAQPFPCVYWEIEIYQNGHLEVECSSDLGRIEYDEEALKYLEKLFVKEEDGRPET